VRQTKTALAELMARDLAGEEIKVLMLDGEHLAERCVVVALAITADGTKKPIGLWDGSTENKTVVRALLADRSSWHTPPTRLRHAETTPLNQHRPSTNKPALQGDSSL